MADASMTLPLIEIKKFGLGHPFSNIEIKAERKLFFEFYFIFFQKLSKEFEECRPIGIINQKTLNNHFQ